MSILKVAQMGHPLLRINAVHIKKGEIKDPSLQRLIDNMIDTMEEYGGVGLAAPQVHESKKIVVIKSNSSKRYPDAPEIPLIALLNPEITFYSEEIAEGFERCLSIKDITGVVQRSVSVKVEGMDRKGKNITLNAEGFQAVVLQHEIDHLNSTLFVDRMDSMGTLCFKEEFEQYNMSTTSQS